MPKLDRGALQSAVRRYLAPGALAVLALYQVYLVRTENLTPWKGGGFGMFSTVDSGGSRVIRVLLVKERDGEVRELAVTPPYESRYMVERLRYLPTPQRARVFAGLMSVADWREPPPSFWTDRDAYVGAILSNPSDAEAAREVRDLIERPRAWVFGLGSTERFGPGAPVDYDYVVVELWSPTYERDRRAQVMSELAVERWPPPAGRR